MARLKKKKQKHGVFFPEGPGGGLVLLLDGGRRTETCGATGGGRAKTPSANGAAAETMSMSPSAASPVVPNSRRRTGVDRHGRWPNAFGIGVGPWRRGLLVEHRAVPVPDVVGAKAAALGADRARVAGVDWRASPPPDGADGSAREVWAGAWPRRSVPQVATVPAGARRGIRNASGNRLPGPPARFEGGRASGGGFRARPDTRQWSDCRNLVCGGLDGAGAPIPTRWTGRRSLTASAGRGGPGGIFCWEAVYVSPVARRAAIGKWGDQDTAGSARCEQRHHAPLAR